MTHKRYIVYVEQTRDAKGCFVRVTTPPRGLDPYVDRKKLLARLGVKRYWVVSATNPTRARQAVRATHGVGRGCKAR